MAVVKVRLEFKYPTAYFFDDDTSEMRATRKTPGREASAS